MNDKAIVQRTQESFDVVVLQGNLAVSARRGLSSWLDLDRPFWIDPITYAFAANPSYLMSEQKIRRGQPETRVDFKRTFRDLAKEYGEPFTRVIAERRSLQPGDVALGSEEELVRRVIEWQRTVLEPTAADRRFLPEEEALLEPVLLTVPFFPLRLVRVGDDPVWLDVNIRLAEAATRLYDPERLAVGLLIEDSLFDESGLLEGVIERYLQLHVRHLWLWISDNDEVTMSLPRARRLRQLVADANARGFTVHQAFAGSFSCLLLSETLTSIGYGVGYWEHKTWEPLAGGGLPTLRYFYPPLGQRLRFLDADAVNDAVIDDATMFHERVCACETCVETIAGDLANFAQYGLVVVRSRTDRRGHRIEYDVPVPAALVKTKEHYLRTRGDTALRALSANFRPRENLDSVLTGFSVQQAVDLRYLENWRLAFEDS